MGGPLRKPGQESTVAPGPLPPIASPLPGRKKRKVPCGAQGRFSKVSRRSLGWAVPVLHGVLAGASPAVDIGRPVQQQVQLLAAAGVVRELLKALGHRAVEGAQVGLPRREAGGRINGMHL